MGHGRDQIQYLAIGGSRDGTVQAYRIEVLGNAGAYCMLGGFLPFFTHVMASGVYDIPKIETAARRVVTNTTPTVAYRGAGRPEATAAIERAMDLFAAEIGMDPVDVRRKNLINKRCVPRDDRRWALCTTPVTTSVRSTSCSKRADYARVASRAEGPSRARRCQATRHRCGGLRRDHVRAASGHQGVGQGRDQRRRQRHHLFGLAVARAEPRHRVRDVGDRADRHPDGRDRPRAGRHRRVPKGSAAPTRPSRCRPVARRST